MNKSDFIFINLLPYRERQKKEQTKQFILLMSLFSLVAIFILFLMYSIFSISIDAQNSRNEFISKRNKKLDEDIRAIAGLQNEIRATLEKRSVVENLQVNRSDSVGILNDISLQLPDGVTLKSVIQQDKTIRLVGVTNSNNKVSTYMTNLAATSTFQNPQLIEVKAARQTSTNTTMPTSNTRAGIATPDQTLSEFTIEVELKRKQELIGAPSLDTILGNDNFDEPNNQNTGSIKTAKTIGGKVVQGLGQSMSNSIQNSMNKATTQTNSAIKN